MADFDMTKLNARERYNLITGTVVPRPIALVTTLDGQGTVNAAPFSYFNALGSNPPIVAFAPGAHSVTPMRIKDTRNNVLSTGEFVVNMVPERLAEAMTIAAAVFPEDESEVDHMGVTLKDSTQVRPPRIAESPVNLECKFLQAVDIGLNKVLFGEVVHIHVEDQLIDVERMYIRYEAVDFLGRLPGGSGVYCRTTDRLVLPRLTYEQVMAGIGVADVDPGETPEEVEIVQRIAPQIDTLMNGASTSQVETS